MAIQSNRYNDPALGEAFNNIASIFAPPGAQDLVGYATAKAKKEDAERLAWLFANANDPLASARSAVTGVQTFGNTPSGFFQTDATNRRGQDVTASTSIANNAADNTRALATNAADNERALATNTADNSRSFAETMYGMTLAPGEMTVPLPSSVADMYSVEPRGTIAGAPKPLSLTEQQALERQDLIAGGDLTNQMMLDAILGEQAPVKVVDASGNVTYATPGSAIGQTPFIDAGNAPAKEIYSYVTPDGQQGSATFDPSSGVLNDVATGAVLPQGTKTMKLQGEDATAMAGTPSNVTLGQRTVAEATYAKTRLDSYRKLLQDNPGAAGVPGMIRGFAQDVVSGIGEMSAEYGTSANIPIEEVRALAERVTQGERDPAIRAAQSYAIEMAYAQAKLGDPGGEVNVREFERLLGVYDGGIAGNAGVLESLAVFEEQISQRLAYGQALQAGGGAAAVPTPAAPAAGTVMQFNEQGIQIQ